MKLEFDSIDELENFTDWALRYGAAWAAAQRGSTAPAPVGGSGAGGAGASASMGQVTIVAGGAAGTAGASFDSPQQPLRPTASVDGAGNVTLAGPHDALQGDTLAAEDTSANGEKKRKRRTKAEIEADEKAAAEDKASREAALARVAAATDPAPTGANPFEQPAAGGTEAPAAPAESAPAADAGAESDAEEVVTPFQHLTRAREFIAKHGMPKYNETFAKASLDPNVMAYTAYQRALHMTAMDELDKA